MKSLLLALLLFSAFGITAQNQIDFRGLLSVNLEKKVSKRVSFTAMAAGMMTYDFQELGFAFFDAGIKCKITKNIGVNANYRFMFLRNLENFYANRHFFYADVDFTKTIKRWSIGGTARFQSYFYNHVVESYKKPLFYNRDKVNLKYRINYYWQPLIEFEVFFPLNHPIRKTCDQVRAMVGVGYTINDHVKLEIYEQVQQQLNRAPKNTNFVTAMNWYFRF